MIQLPIPPLPPGDPELPLPGPLYTFIACLVLVFVAVEMLVGILPKGWQRRVNQIRFGPKWKG